MQTNYERPTLDEYFSGDSSDAETLANALLGAEEILEVLTNRGTRGVAEECNLARIWDVYRNVQAAKAVLAKSAVGG